MAVNLRRLSTANLEVDPFLGERIRLHRSNSKRERDFVDQLVCVSRLPWFRVGIIPSWLRELLTQAMEEHEYRQARQILSDLFLTALRPERTAIPVLIAQDPTEKGRIEGGPRDEVLVDFLVRPPKERTSTPLPEHVASRFPRNKVRRRAFLSVFSGGTVSEIRKDTVLVRSALEEANISAIVTRLVSDKDAVDPDYRTIDRMVARSGDELPGDGLILYLPPGRGCAFIVSDWAVILGRRARKFAFLLGMANLVLVILSLWIFYGDPDRANTNVALDILLAISWITIPFLSLYGTLVYPIDKSMREFPLAKPAGLQPPHLARTFDLSKQ